MRALLAAIALLALSTCAPAPAFAAAQCGQFVEIQKELAKHHQTRVGLGYVSTNVVMAIFASAGGANWTALSINADGSACVMAMGEDWNGDAPEAPGEDA